jgi:magnesium transporter
VEFLSELSEIFIQKHPVDAAKELEHLPLPEISTYLEDLSPEGAALILQSMLPGLAGACLADMSLSSKKNILQTLSNDTIALLIASFDLGQKEKILEALPEENSKTLRMLLSYPARSAGNVMDSSVASWFSGMNVPEVIQEMGKRTRQASGYLYVTDREGLCVGVLSHWELVTSDKTSTLEDIMHTSFDFLQAQASSQDIIAHVGWRRFHALPVLDDEGRFLGVVRYKTLRSLEEELKADSNVAVRTALSFGEMCWEGMLSVGNEINELSRHRNENNE